MPAIVHCAVTSGNTTGDALEDILPIDSKTKQAFKIPDDHLANKPEYRRFFEQICSWTPVRNESSYHAHRRNLLEIWGIDQLEDPPEAYKILNIGRERTDSVQIPSGCVHLRGLQCEGRPGEDLHVARFHLDPDGCLEVANCVAHATNPKNCRLSRSYSKGDQFKLRIRQRLPSDQDRGAPEPAYACHLTPPFILDSDKTFLEAVDRAIRSFSPLDPPTPHPARTSSPDVRAAIEVRGRASPSQPPKSPTSVRSHEPTPPPRSPSAPISDNEEHAHVELADLRPGPSPTLGPFGPSVRIRRTDFMPSQNHMFLPQDDLAEVTDDEGNALSRRDNTLSLRQLDAVIKRGQNRRVKRGSGAYRQVDCHLGKRDREVLNPGLGESSTSAKKIKKEPTIPLDPDDSEEEESLETFLARHDRLSQEEKEQQRNW